MAKYNEKIAEQIIQEVETILNKHGYDCCIYDDEDYEPYVDAYPYNVGLFDKHGNDRYIYPHFNGDDICEIKLWDDEEKQYKTPIEIIVEIFNAVLYEYTEKYDGEKWE